MLLIDEKDNDIVVDYKVKFTRDAEIDMFKNFKLLLEDVQCLKKYYFGLKSNLDIIYEKGYKLDDPFVKLEKQVLLDGISQTSLEKYYSSRPFTLLFMFNLLNESLSFDLHENLDKNQYEKINYLEAKAKYFDTNKLKYLYDNIGDAKKFGEFIDEVINNNGISSLNKFLQYYYPDIAYFRKIFNYTEFSKKGEFSIMNSNLYAKGTSEEKNSCVNDEINEALKNTQIINQLRLFPKYK